MHLYHFHHRNHIQMQLAYSSFVNVMGGIVDNKTQPNQSSLTSRLQIKQWQWCKMATLLKATALCNSAQHKVTAHKAQYQLWMQLHPLCQLTRKKHSHVWPTCHRTPIFKIWGFHGSWDWSSVLWHNAV
jgi:hypothetical protein